MSRAIDLRARRAGALVAFLLCLGLAAPAAWAGDAPAAAGDRDKDWAAWLALYAKRGDGLKAHKKAMVALAKVTEQYPDDYEIQWQAARAFYYFSERYQKEKDDLKRAAKMSKFGQRFGSRALKIQPKGYDARYWHLMNYVRVVAAESKVRALREAKDIKKKLERLIKDQPKRFEAYMVLGGLYRALPGFPASFGDVDKSLEILKKAESLGSPTAELLIEIAETYVVMDKKAEAKAYYQKAAKAKGFPGMDFELEDAHRYAKKRASEL